MESHVHSEAINALVEEGSLPADPTVRLLSSDEPYAVWLTLTALLGRGPEDPDVRQSHNAVLEHPGVVRLLGELSEAGKRKPRDHHSPQFLPNRLNLLRDLGVSSGESAALDAVLRDLLSGQDRAGRFRSPGSGRAKPETGSVLCESNAITEVLLRFGFAHDAGVQRAVSRLIADVHQLDQGFAWPCTPERKSIFSAAPRNLDACPQITLEGLGALSMLPRAQRPKELVAAARTPLEIWRRRSEARPYEFGHGYLFKTVKWPSFWYDVLSVVDTVGRVPDVWKGPDADPEDRRSMAELAACLIAYNMGPDGLVTPRRVHKGYEQFSFGNKLAPSAFATARVLVALVRVADLAAEIAAIDVEALPASLGSGDSAASAAEGAFAACPIPHRRSYESSRVLPRLIARHHLDTPWEMQSPESIASDIVALPAADPAAMYLSVAARLPRFDPNTLDVTLDDRRSLVRVRCMRGQLYAVRRDTVSIVHAASVKQVVRFAREFALKRGVTPDAYEALAPRVLEACAETPMTRGELRERLRPGVDLAAVVSLMTAEKLLLQSAYADGHFGRHPTYVPFAAALPDVDLDRFDQDDARPLLLRAYVRGFGPVSHHDAAWWTGMDLKRVRRSLEALEEELVEVTFDRTDEPWLMHAADAEELERAAFLESPNVALLPANDPLLVGYAQRSRFVDDVARRFVFDASGNAAPVVLVDGRIVAVWDFEAPANERPRVLVFPTAPIEAEAADSLARHAEKVGLVRFGSAPEVTTVSGMRPLTSRPIGAYRHPLH